MTLSPFVIGLLRKKSGSDLRTSRDCEVLAYDIESALGEHAGVNTMKRLLGFIADERTPRVSTLDVIARYLDYENWDALRLADENISNSGFDDADEYLACRFSIGQQVSITYPPNRSLVIEYLGDNQFRVNASENGKLQEGDLLTLTHLVRHYPMIVSDVIRDGQSLGSFTAGKQRGIDFKLL